MSIRAWMTSICAALMGMGIAAHAQTVRYIHTDALGSPVAVTNASRTVIEISEYEPYGQVVNRPVKAGPGYTGHVMDASTGLAYMQQRYYDPMLGRFLSADPVTAYEKPSTNFNRYIYARNNPYKFTDPDGRDVKCNGQTCQISSRNAGEFVFVDMPRYTMIKMGSDAIDAAVGFIKIVEVVGDLIQSTESSEPKQSEGRRRKNRIPDRGQPGTIGHNPPGTTGKEYGVDGWVETEWNDGHGPDAPEGEREDHVHDHEPNPHHPEGRPTRRPGREPTPEERERFRPKPEN